MNRFFHYIQRLSRCGNGNGITDLESSVGLGANLRKRQFAVDVTIQKRKVLSIVPSLDTPVCAASARKFNTDASALADTVVLVISADLPFAAKRFCEAEGLQNVNTLSTFRNPAFAQDYGVAITSGPLAGVTARAVVVLDANDKVLYSQLVPEIKEEPDYAAALAALK